MNKTTEILFATLRTALSGQPLPDGLFDGLKSEQWEELLKLSVPHNVVALVFDAIEQLTEERKPPKQVYLKWAVLADQVEQQYAHKTSTIVELLKLFNNDGIRTMILKGVGISFYYPQPNHRSFSDFDIYQFGDIERADYLVSQSLGIKVCGDVHHHTKYVYRKMLVENHYDFVETHSHRSSAQYEKMLKEEVQNGCREVEISGEKAVLPSPTFNALFLMRHMASHYAAERISVRHLLDWKLFVEHEFANVDWLRINEIFAQYNMSKFVGAVNGILIEHMGMDSSLLPAFERDKALEDRILNDILFSEFSVKCPKKSSVAIVWWKMRRFWANRWKHKLIYNESWIRTFFCSTYSHLLKPKTITH